MYRGGDDVEHAPCSSMALAHCDCVVMMSIKGKLRTRRPSEDESVLLSVRASSVATMQFANSPDWKPSLSVEIPTRSSS